MKGRLIAGGLLTGVLLLGGFAWGYVAHRDEGFPMPALRAAVRAWKRPTLARPPEASGRWRTLDGRRPWLRQDDQAYTAERLLALGYAEGTLPAPDRVGVVVHTDAAAPGLNLITSGHAPEATLMDLDGQVVHRWQASPRLFASQRDGTDHVRPYFRRARLLPDGGLIAIFVDHGVFRLDRDSNVVWAWAGKAHHDLQIDGDGRVVVLARTLRDRPVLDSSKSIADDEVVVLDVETGAELRRFALYDAIASSPWAGLLQDRPVRDDGDPLHTNSLQVLDGRFADLNPAFAEGNLLLSMRHTSLVLVVDPQTVQVVWAWRGPWFQQHEPTLVEPGHLLIFDNMGAWPRSRVLELDPVSQQVVWAWDGGNQPLISEMCSTAARLSNGNTLAVASETGRAVEVTPDGEVVWSWFSPARAGDEQELVATLFQVERLDRSQLGVLADLLVPAEPTPDVRPTDAPAEPSP